MRLTNGLLEDKRRLFGITYEPRKEVIPEIMRKYIEPKKRFNNDPDFAINKITNWLAHEKQVSVDDIYSNKRFRSLCDARHILFFLIYYSLPINQTYISIKFNKHPSSISNSIEKVQHLFINSLDFQAFIKQFDSFYFDRVAK